VTNAPAKHGELVGKLALAALLLTAAGVLYFTLGDALSLAELARHEAAWRAWQADHPVQAYAVAFVVYVAVTALSLPGATVLTLAYGWLFGFLPAVILVSFASTTGATLAMLLSRYLLRDLVRRRFGARLEAVDAALAREGAYYLFTLRLIPAVPFFVLNVVMGLTPIAASTFAWVSQLGMLPGTCVYVYAGASVPTLAHLAERGVAGILTGRVATALVLLGLFPLVVRRAARWLQPVEVQRSSDP
jgi:uncharacterized membrane protein YdjX (TVP38/TMEM64 family)